MFLWAGGFAGNTGHDPHVLYTLSAVQILALFDKLDILDVGKVSSCILWHLASLLLVETSYYYAKKLLQIFYDRYHYGFLYTKLDVAGLQNEDGSFSGDIWGEVDTR